MDVGAKSHNGGAGGADGGPDAAPAPPPSVSATLSASATKACTSGPPPATGLSPLAPVTPLSRVLDLPSFVLASFFLYWSVPLGVLLGLIRPWAGSKRRDDALGWAVTLQRLMAVRMKALPGHALYTAGPALYMANHRSWADFYLDPVATGGRAQMLSRMAVAAAFPLMMPAVVAIRAVILFNRGRGAAADHAGFNAFVRGKMEASPMPGLIVYPEGHRSTRPDPLPFKHGMLRFAHAEGVPVQAVVSAGKEGVMAEKLGSARWGRTVVVAYGPPIQPRDFSDFKAFLTAFTASFTDAWARAHAPGAVDEAVDFPAPRLDAHVYVPAIQRAQAVVSTSILVVFLALMAWCAAAGARVLARLPHGAVAALLAWCVLSCVRAWAPVVGGLPQGSGRPARPRAE